MTLKNKQNKVVLTMLSIFIGSWLLLLCQTCLAMPAEVDLNNKADIETSCHQSEENLTVEQDNDHCVGVCDCDDPVALMKSEKNIGLMDKIKLSPDLYVFTHIQIQLPLSTPRPYRLLKIPEKAIQLPFQTYNILLI